MAGSVDRILTTHVGSLVRPPALVEFLHKIEDRAEHDPAAYEACLAQSIDDVVRQQVEAGIDIVSDGEFSKGRNWAFYIHDRLTGGVQTRALNPEELKAADVLRFFTEGTKLERLALGEPEALQRQELTGKGGGPLHFSHERYLVNQIRRRFGFLGTPIVVKTRSKEPAGRSGRAR